jgi:hypothetical protein
MNEDELGQVNGEGEGEGELDEETMQLIAQLLQEGYTEDEIVEAILSAEEGGGEESPVEDEVAKKEDPNDDRFADGGFAASEPPKKESPKKADKPKKDDKPKKEGYAKGGYVKPPKNRLAVAIGQLGRFN